MLIRSLQILGGCLMIGLGLLSLPAEGHTRLLASVPASGQTLPQPPEHITLRFSSPVEATFSQVELSQESNQDNQQSWQRLKTRLKGQTITCDLPRLRPATYQVRWRVLSRDGHIQRGHFNFTLSRFTMR